MITHELTKVTPRLAREYLTYNTNNRPLSKRRVTRYAKDIMTGCWQFNGKTICFDYQGKLLDGQHTLNAIIEANKPLNLLVVKGLNPTAMSTIDTGKSRTAKDVIFMQSGLSVGKAASIAKGIKLILSYKENTNVSTYITFMGNLTNHQIVEYFNFNEESVIESCNYIHDTASISKYKILNRGIALALHILAKPINELYIDKYTHQLYTGENLTKSDPAWKVRNILIENATNPLSKINEINIFKILILGWNMLRAGRKGTKTKLLTKTNEMPTLV